MAVRESAPLTAKPCDMADAILAAPSVGEACCLCEKRRPKCRVDMRQGKKWQACRDVSDRFHTECGEIEEQHEGAGEHHAHEGCRKLWHEAGNERDDGEDTQRDCQRRSMNVTKLSDDLC